MYNTQVIALINTIRAAHRLLSYTDNPVYDLPTVHTVMSNPVGLAYLPEDLLLEIAAHISVFDVLSLKQVRVPPSLLIGLSRSSHCTHRSDVPDLVRLRLHRLPLASHRPAGRTPPGSSARYPSLCSCAV